MNAGAVIVARARSDRDERLLSADEPLAALQRACGGAIPGIVAIPQLLELVRKAGHYRMKLARVVHARDESNAISAWVEVSPDDEGCALAISNWRAAPLASAEAIGGGDDLAGVAAQCADLHARLDARQQVLAVGRASTLLEPVAATMREACGRPWTDFVEVAGNSHRQPLHWRLLDGAQVTCGDVPGRWVARLFPLGGEHGAVAGFELYLVAVDAGPLPDSDAPEPSGDPAGDPLDGVLGRDLAPALRQPIARIIANAETIRTRLAGPLADEYAGYAGDIADAARHLQGLVEDLADLDAIEAPGFAPAPDRIDLADAARRAAGILGVRARERSIVVEVPGDGVEVPAVGEYRRVLQVLLNLLGNALRYSPEGSIVRLEVELRGERASVTVTDDGPGLTREQQTKVFNKFERLGRGGDGGSGLGLYISRFLARAMGGDLTVASVPGEGAEFTLELPQT